MVNPINSKWRFQKNKDRCLWSVLILIKSRNVNGLGYWCGVSSSSTSTKASKRKGKGKLKASVGFDGGTDALKSITTRNYLLWKILRKSRKWSYQTRNSISHSRKG